MLLHMLQHACTFMNAACVVMYHECAQVSMCVLQMLHAAYACIGVLQMLHMHALVYCICA